MAPPRDVERTTTRMILKLTETLFFARTYLVLRLAVKAYSLNTKMDQDNVIPMKAAL